MWICEGSAFVVLSNITKYYYLKSLFPRVLFSERGFCVAAGDIGDIGDIGWSDNSHGNFVFIILTTSICHENFPHKQIPIHGKF